MSYHPLQLAEAFIKAGELEDALDALNTVLDTEPDNDTARRLRAGVLARLPGDGHAAQALDDLRALANPDTEDILLESRLVQAIEDIDAAIRVIEAALTRFPADPRLSERLLGLLRETGEPAKAEAVLANLPDDDWRWLAWSGDFAADKGDDPAAVRYYSAALDLIAASHSLPAQPARMTGDATNLDAATLTVAASAARIVLSRAHAYRRAGNIAAAQTGYERAAVLLPTDPAIPFYQGMVAALQGDISAGVVLCRDALRAAPAPLRRTLHAELAANPRLMELSARLKA